MAIAKPAAEDAVPTLRGRLYTSGTTAPAYVEEGWLWADTNTNPPTVKQYINGVWVALTSLYSTGRQMLANNAGGTATTPIGDTVTLSGLSIAASKLIDLRFNFIRSGAGNITLGLKLNTTVIQDTLLNAVAAAHGTARIIIPRRDLGIQSLGATARHGVCNISYGSAAGTFSASAYSQLGVTNAVPLNTTITSIAIRGLASTGSVEIRSVQLSIWN